MSSKLTYRVRNWGKYNRYLINRGNITFWFSKDSAAGWYYQGKHKRGGIIKYADAAIICVLTLRNLYKIPLRASQGLVESLITLTRLKLEAPNYSTLSRRAGKLKICLSTVNIQEPLHVLIDSTGIKIYGESEWKSVKHGTYRYQVWRKLHIMMDVKRQIILSADYSECGKHDSNYLPLLLDQIEEEVERITGDGAYDKKKCYQASDKRKLKLVSPPQHNAIVQRNKHKKANYLLARDQAIKEIEELGGEGLKEWKRKENYHKRSLVETAMFRIKTIFGETVYSRKVENQKAELLIRCAALNRITALGMPEGQMILI